MMCTMLRTRRTRGTALVVALAIVAVACTDDDSSTDDTEPAVDVTVEDDVDGTDAPAELTGDGLTIGHIRPETPGLFDSLGRAQADAIALAAADIEAAGGVLDGPLVVNEDAPSPDRAIDVVFGDLVDEGTRVIVGPSSSDEVRALLPLLVPADALLCGASTTGQDITGVPEAEGRFTRTVLDDGIVAIHTTRVLRERTANILDRPAKITIAVRQDSYGDSISASLVGLLGVSGFEVTVVGYAAEDVALEGVGEEIADTGADQVVLIALEEGPRLADLTVRAGVAPTSILGLDGLATPRFAEQADAAEPTNLDGVTIIGSTGDAAFLSRLVEVDSGQVLYGAQAYDCAISLALAAEATGSTEPGALSTALREVTANGEPCTTYADCKELLAAGVDIDYIGPSGPIGIDEAGDPSGGRFVTAVVTDGQLRIVSDLRIDLDQLRLQAAPRIAGFIAAVQADLALLGFYDGPIDGQQSEELTEAIRAFQEDQGLEATGELNVETIQALQAAVGERSSLLTGTVAELQQLLTDLGFYSGPIDGIYSAAVADAVRALQAELGVPQTGIMDAATLRAIYLAGVASGEEVVPPPDPAPTTTAPAPTTTTATTEPPASSVPEGTTVLDALRADPDFSEFVALLENTPALAPVVDVLSDPTRTLTVFAPTNDALGAVPPGADPVEIVGYHALNEALLAAALTPGQYQTLLPGAVLTVEVDPDGTIRLVDDADGATVLAAKADIAAGTSVVHGIDAVLTPPAP
jgi:branched-chain amino acid transport system substrate-binding protein